LALLNIFNVYGRPFLWYCLYMQNDWSKAEKVLKDGGVIIAPTDTLYGILARAEDKRAVERIYKIKGRDIYKPFIILITDIKDLNKFGVEYSNIQENSRMFPKGKKVSFILACDNKKFEYLHRGSKSLAFRIISPRNKNLFTLIKNVGPLVAPSANPQGLNPAKTIWEAKKYFGNQIDMYMCGGTRNSKPSTVISFLDKKPKVLRK
jgi:L-threonylcarbamoyladenylate synthase